MSYSVTSWQGHMSMERLRCTLSTFHAEVNVSNTRILEFRSGDKHSTATRQRQRIARLPTSHISTHYRGACTLTRRAPSRMPRMPRMPQTRRTRALARKCDASPRSRITRAQIRLLCGFASFVCGTTHTNDAKPHRSERRGCGGQNREKRGAAMGCDGAGRPRHRRRGEGWSTVPSGAARSGVQRGGRETPTQASAHSTRPSTLG